MPAKPSTSRSNKPPPADTWSARVLHGDCLEVMAAMEPESVHAVVCDPPYGLEFMGKEWDSFRIDSRAARWTGEMSGGAGAGFGEIPGGATLPAFGKRRTTSTCRACGKRDAFRNPHACGDAADWVTIPVDNTPMEMRAFQNWCALWSVEALRVLKPGGHLLAFGGTRTYHRLVCALEEAGFEIRDSLHWIYGSGFPKSLDVSKAIDDAAGVDRPDRVTSDYGNNEVFSATKSPINKGDPVTAAAAAWQGWGTALKPSHEPVVLARKLLTGTVAANVLEHGTGALNVTATRVGSAGGTKGGERNENWRPAGTNEQPSVVDIVDIDAGRWPANLLLAHLPECAGTGPNHTDVLCAEGCPARELNAMSGESQSQSMTLPLAPGDARGESHGNRDASSVRGHDGSGGAARFFYIAKPRRRERVGGTMRNLHPTVKPIDLMRYLVRLVTPPDGVVLDPFLGSGTTGCAAMVEGFRFIGIEREQESYETALARISDYAFAHGRPKPLTA